MFFHYSHILKRIAVCSLPGSSFLSHQQGSRSFDKDPRWWPPSACVQFPAAQDERTQEKPFSGRYCAALADNRTNYSVILGTVLCVEGTQILNFEKTVNEQPLSVRFPAMFYSYDATEHFAMRMCRLNESWGDQGARDNKVR